MTTRKKIMKQKEMVWRNSKKLNDLEEVAKERAQDLLQRASQLRMEQEEELKDMRKVSPPFSLPPLISLSLSFFPLAVPHSLRDLSSLTRDRIHAPCSGSTES